MNKKRRIMARQYWDGGFGFEAKGRVSPKRAVRGSANYGTPVLRFATVGALEIVGIMAHPILGLPILNVVLGGRVSPKRAFRGSTNYGTPILRFATVGALEIVGIMARQYWDCLC